MVSLLFLQLLTLLCISYNDNCWNGVY